MYSSSPFLTYIIEFAYSKSRNLYEFASLIGVSQPTISRIVTGKTTITTQTIVRIYNQCSAEEKHTLLTEYLNHRLFEIDPSLHGRAGIRDDGILSSPKPHRLRETFDDLAKENPVSVDRITSGLDKLSQALKEFKESV